MLAWAALILTSLGGCASNPAPRPEDSQGESDPRCLIHLDDLLEMTVPVSYGLHDDFYMEQRSGRFPHNEFAPGGCVVPARRESRRVLVCAGCKVAEREFRRNYSAEWAAYLAALDENGREDGETLEDLERDREQGRLDREDERSEDRSQPGRGD